MKVAIVTTRPPGNTSGGAERFFDALVSEFCAAGHDARELMVPAVEPDFVTIQHNYLACYDLDVSGYDIVVSTKAPTWLVRHPHHVCYMVHTIRVFYDMFDTAFPLPPADVHTQRRWIHDVDSAALAPPRCKSVFAIGNEVSARLREWNRIDAEVLHPPLWGHLFHSGPTQAFVLLPGRLHAWKRVDLAIRAMRYVASPLRLVITGSGEAEAELRLLAAGDNRIEFRGRVADDELVELYANALAALFVPVREDYGYVTLEAFASGKPVVTCRDSGEAATIVGGARAGYVIAPEPIAIAAALDRLYDNPGLARKMGLRGQAWANRLSWPNIVARLVAAATT